MGTGTHTPIAGRVEMYSPMYFSCVGEFLYYSAAMSPKYEGQRHKGLCPVLKKVIRWEARYHGDSLEWWCAHRKVSVEKTVVNRKKVVQ